MSEAAEAVDHPAHYGGVDDPYEVIKVAEAWGFDNDAYRFNALKYLRRGGLKVPTLAAEIEDLRKAVWYLLRKIGRLELQLAKERVDAKREHVMQHVEANAVLTEGLRRARRMAEATKKRRR